MARSNRDRSFEEPRFPQGTIVLAVILTILAAGIYLIVRGLL